MPSGPQQQCQLRQTTYRSGGCTNTQKIVLSAAEKLDSQLHTAGRESHRQERNQDAFTYTGRRSRRSPNSPVGRLKNKTNPRSSALHSQSSTSSGLRSLSSSSSSSSARLLYSCWISLLTSTSTRCLTGGALWSQRE